MCIRDSLLGIADRTLLVWQQRQVFEFFEDRFTPNRGRRLYAPIDIFQVAIVHLLTSRLKMPPSVYSGEIATALMDVAKDHFLGWWKTLGYEDEQAKKNLENVWLNPFYLILYMRGDLTYHILIRLNNFKEIYSEDSQEAVHWLSQTPHIVVPLSKTINEICEGMKNKFDTKLE